MTFDPKSRARLSPHAIARFPGDSLFDRIARTVCRADCLPRKELYESWEVARRVRRVFRGGRVVDLAAGHGLLAYICLILDDSSAEALVVDRRLPKSASKLAAALVEEWPRLTGRIVSREADVQDVVLSPGDLVVSVHACGGLTDVVLGRALAASARVAVLPCCHDARENDTGGLAGWLSADMAIDVTRASRLRAAGYRVRTQRIVEGITEKSRLLMGEPGQRR